MSLTDILKMLFGGKLPVNLSNLKLDHWTVSHDGVRKGPVVSARVGIKNIDIFWAHISFIVDGIPHTLDVERGLKGGVSTIIFDGASVVGGSIAFKTHAVGFPPKFKFELSVHLPTTTFRFDANIK